MSGRPRQDYANDRAIIHVDMDAFYASVEQLDRPEYRGLPVIVGGVGRRGVVAAASYEARRFGVHSAMPTARARGLCPDGIYLPSRMARYREVSGQVFEVFHEITPLVEGLSVDEAFLDVTGSRSLFGDIEAIGWRIKREIRERLGLVASIGMAPNKFLAKLASDHDKPDGFLHVRAGEARQFLGPLAVERLWGIGPKAGKRLRAAGIETVGHLAEAPAEQLRRLLGSAAERYRELALGIDERPVTPDTPEKQVSHEETYERDLYSLDAMRRELMHLSEKVGTRLRRKGLTGATVTVKIRTGEWRTYSRSRTLGTATAETGTIYGEAASLVERWRSEHPRDGVRLLGVGVSRLSEGAPQVLFDTGKRGRVDRALDGIRERFGSDAVVRGRLLDDDDNSGTD